MGAKKTITVRRQKYLDKVSKKVFTEQVKETYEKLPKKEVLPKNNTKNAEKFYRIEIRNFEAEPWIIEVDYMDKKFCDGFIYAMGLFSEPSFAKVIHINSGNTVNTYPKK